MKVKFVNKWRFWSKGLWEFTLFGIMADASKYRGKWDWFAEICILNFGVCVFTEPTDA